VTRALVCLALAIASFGACGDDDNHDGTVFFDAAVDGNDGGADADVRSCAATNLCTEGPTCGAGCCTYGEYCLNGECRCGDEAACADGDYCTSGGPLLPANGCGLFCCGPASGVGCPI
jgi:hypothetical protein